MIASFQPSRLDGILTILILLQGPQHHYTFTMAHVRKKQILAASQPSITSYFDRRTTTSSDHHSTPPLRPELPQTIQSSLLNVGMRVRKSVPEGYKTHKTMCDDPFPAATQTPSTRTTHTVPTPAAAAPPSSAPPIMLRADSSRELMPFCGLHTVGSMAQGVPGLSGVPSLVSQASAASTYTQASSCAGEGLKRSYSDEMEAELDDEYESMDEPRRERILAHPTARLKAGHGHGDVGVVVAGDFHDADVEFLQ